MKWITTDILPPMEDLDSYLISGEVIVYVVGRGVRFGYVTTRKDGSSPRWHAVGYLGDFKITHWMPLPSKPDEERE
jgi:hypothetical protein